ncbi:MAG: aminopeptidase [Bacteroidetes bacterium]|nr:aminopeptidase [Bacteroidota bacterium]
MKINKITILYICTLVWTAAINAQPTINTNKKDGGYTFTMKKTVGCTDVKNQYKSGTCWSYSTQSFLESEVMRNKKINIDLSEMFVVRNTYIQKAISFLRYQGTTNFSAGGEPHDVINTVREYGIVPQEVYSGMPAGQTKPEHGEIDRVLKAMLDAMVKLPDGKLNPNWKAAFLGALNGYMGAAPDIFTYEGKTYTPLSFAKYLGINADDYVEITSFTHHPFYTEFIMEVSDNWSNSPIYNVPLEDLKRIADNALTNNYSIEWASDVSEKGFNFKNGLAIVPEKNYDDMTQAEKDSMFTKPDKEKVITQQMRQEAFDNLTTTDDHGMQMVGMAKDQDGHDYYLVKNSWGTDRNDLGGYFYCSAPYFMFKTTSIMVNKNAIPKDIASKMGIKL